MFFVCVYRVELKGAVKKSNCNIDFIDAKCKAIYYKKENKSFSTSTQISTSDKIYYYTFLN